MVACSSRRKTKHPFCGDDPKCYWNNRSCKNKPGVKRMKKRMAPNDKYKRNAIEPMSQRNAEMDAARAAVARARNLRPNTRRNMNANRERLHQDPNSKLNMILHKLKNIEAKLEKMTRKNTNNLSKPKSMKSNRETAIKSNRETALNSNRNINNNGSAKTASPTNVKLLLNRSGDNTAETASPSAVNRLREEMKSNQN